MVRGRRDRRARRTARGDRRSRPEARAGRGTTLGIPGRIDQRVEERASLGFGDRVANTSSNWSTARTSRSPGGTCARALRARLQIARSDGRGRTRRRGPGARPAQRSDDLPLPDGPMIASSGASTSRRRELVDESLTAEEDVRVLAARRARVPCTGRRPPAAAVPRVAVPLGEVQRRVLHEDRPLELLQLDAGLEPELVVQERPRPPVDLEPFGLTTRTGRARASAARGSARGRDTRAASASSSETSARWRPSASSASMRASTAASRSSSSRSTSTRANGSNSRSASGRPCHNDSATRKRSPHLRRRRRQAPRGRRRRDARSARGRARRARRAAGSRVRARRAAARRRAAAPSTFRSRETWLRSAWSAEFTLCSAKSSPISRSRATTRFALSSSSASSARCFGPPAATARRRSEPPAGRGPGTRVGSFVAIRLRGVSIAATLLPSAEDVFGTGLGHRRAILAGCSTRRNASGPASPKAKFAMPSVGPPGTGRRRAAAPCSSRTTSSCSASSSPGRGKP